MGTSLGQPTAGSTTGRSTAANFCFDELYGTGNGGGGGGGGDRCGGGGGRRGLGGMGTVVQGRVAGAL